MTVEDHGLDHLDRAGRATGHIARQPRAVVYAAVALSVGLAWGVIGAMALRGAETRVGPAAAPGDGLFAGFPHVPLPDFAERFFVLCLTPVSAGATWPVAFLALTAMWFLMALAMMLPSAAPMLRTYCEIADTAAAKGETAVHPRCWSPAICRYGSPHRSGSPD